MRILVVEDEPAIADFLVRGLESEGYAVKAVGDGEEGEALGRTGEFDLVVLDLMLPGKGGLEVLDTLRAELPGLPVILLTARGEIEERVEGLDRGANDYLTKPFAFDELAARVRAHLRAPAQPSPIRLEAGDLSVDLLSRGAKRAGAEIHLSATEFDLLSYFLRHAGQVVSREQLLSGVWGYDYDPGTNVVGVYVSYLRRKLARPGLPDPIETVRGAGYRLRRDGGAA